MDPFLLCAIIPIKSYSNTEADKDKILSDNKNKSGIYMWTNKTNGKRYVGSSETLKIRFSQYFNVYHLHRSNSMYICRALLKHDYYNFSLEILEYCEPEKCLIREKHYLDIFKPKYNISLNPSAPFSGRTHSDKTKTIMSDAKKGKPKVEGFGNPCQAIEVTDITNNTTTTYNSMREAARALNINNSVIDKYFSRNQTKPYKGQYTFTKTK